jgi:hypothetical protein
MGMNRYRFEWIQDWCQANGWSDPFVERRAYWAFPPCAVLPMPIPPQVLQEIKAEKGLSRDEKIWFTAAGLAGVIGIALSSWLACPIPLVAAFAFCAIVVALFEED